MLLEEVICDYCATIVLVLQHSDYDELEMVAAVRELHRQLNADQILYLAVWERLDSKVRRAFKDWLKYEYLRDPGQATGEGFDLPLED